MEARVDRQIGLKDWQPVMTQITPTETSLYFKAYPGKNYPAGTLDGLTLAPVPASDITRITSLTPDDYAQGLMQFAELYRRERIRDRPHLRNFTLPITFVMLFKDMAPEKREYFMSRMLNNYGNNGIVSMTDESEPGYVMLGLHMDYDPKKARLYINARCDMFAKEEGAPCVAIFPKQSHDKPRPLKERKP